MHVADVKRRKLDPKSEKCILVNYSHEQRGYKSYNPQTKQVRVSSDVKFDESASLYSLLTLTPENSNHPIFKDEASEHEMVQVEEEEEFGSLDESPISFLLSGPNEQLS